MIFTCHLHPRVVSDTIIGPLTLQVVFPLKATKPAYILLRISLPKEALSMPPQITVTGYLGG